MLHRRQCEWIFWIVQTIFTYFLRLLPVKAYLLFIENVFLNESSFPAIRELFFPVETDCMASENHFMPLPQTFFKEPFIPVNGNAFFSPKENVLLFIKNLLFCQWKPLFTLKRSVFKTLITTILFYFSTISVSGNRFSIQQKQYSFIYTIFRNFCKRTLLLLVEANFVASRDDFFSSIFRHSFHCQFYFPD